MITVEEAFQIVQDRLPDFGQASGALEDLTSRILSEPLIADRDYPAIDRATMDGIGVSWDSYQSGCRKFQIEGTCFAGSPQIAGGLPNATSCFEVMTGAAMPVGTDLVIPYEHLELKDGRASVSVEQARAAFENVHRKGIDYGKNDLLVMAGEKLHGPHCGIAASLGYARVHCAKMPKVKIISTGDELVPITESPLAHQIRRSNGHALRALLQENGFSDIVTTHLPDDLEALKDDYRESRAVYDILIYSGGVSKGKRDYLPEVWRDMGVEKYFHGVSQKPGKPFWFGVDTKFKTAVVGLPGNPISCLVCLRRYLIPSRTMFARLTEEIHFAKDLTYFVPVRVEFSSDGTLFATPCLTKNSGEFSGLAGTDGFVELPKERSRFLAGESFRFFSWGKL